MSKIEVNTLVPATGTTLTLGESGDTIALGSGATVSALSLSDNILFSTASKGIYLGVTSATASNLLDDYEEGTWTPTFNRASTDLSSVTYSRQSGTYSKIGQTVIAFFDLQVDSYSGGGGDYRVESLPFSSNMGVSNGGFSRTVVRAASLMSSDFRIYGDSSFVNASNLTLKNYNSSGGEVAVSPNSSGRLTGYIIYTTNA